MIATGHDTRPAILVTRSIGDLAVSGFVATQRSRRAMEAAETLVERLPGILPMLSLAEAQKEVAALAEIHGLLKALAPFEAEVRALIPHAFAGPA